VLRRSWRLTPRRGRGKPALQKDANRAHARLRARGECVSGQLKSWRILRKLRYRPCRAGQLAKTIHVLQTARAPDENVYWTNKP